jgi:acetylglutamate kinase
MKNILIKLGGSVITDQEYRKSIIKQLVELREKGYGISIVHGGGKLISYYLNKLNISSTFHEGLRITTEEILEVVMMALIGKVNKDIVREFNLSGVPAIGLCGGDARLVECNKLSSGSAVELGRVGEPSKVNVDFYNQLIASGYVVVIATIGFGPDGYYNINADHTAAFVAREVKADELIYVSDVDGVIHPESSAVYASLNKTQVEQLRMDNIITSGMLPKLHSCLEALDHGVSKVYIINGKKKNSIFKAVHEENVYGTEILLT